MDRGAARVARGLSPDLPTHQGAVCGIGKRDYYETGHGGNVRLKSREPSDYQIAVLEVGGSEQTTLDILAAEQRWMRKLQSTEMGLNS